MTRAVENWVDNFDNHDPELVDDPYTTFAEMRSRCPVTHSQQHGGFWALTGYKEVWEATHDAEVYLSRPGVTVPSFGNPRPLIPLELDGEMHRHYRRILSPLFSPRSVKMLEPVVRRIADDLIDGFIERGECDLVQEYTRVVPASVLGHIMGVGPEWVPRFIDWAFRVVESDPKNPGGECFAAIGELYGFFGALIDELRADAANTEGEVEFTAEEQDMLRILLRSRIDDEPLPRDDIVDTLFLNVLGGADTTNSVIATSLLHLSKNADDRERLSKDSEAIELAIDEFLRMESPIQGLARTTTQEVVLGGQTIPAGEKLLLCYGAANRDPNEFPDPDTLVLDRPNNRHLAFGSGTHRCLGVHLARLQIRVAVEQILERIPDFKVTAGREVEWAQGHTRSLHHFPASFTPGTRRSRA